MNIFKKHFPYLNAWLESEGELQMGEGYMTSGILRLLNMGGDVWIDEESETIDEALLKAETYLREEFESEFGYKIEL